MKALNILLVVFLAQFVFLKGFSQSVVLVSGDPTVLKGETKIGILYNYDNMKVGKMTEDEYIAKKSDEYNKKTPGKGDQWIHAWKSDRSSRYEPKFEDLLNKNLSKSGVSASPDIKDSKYSIVLHTTFTEPGFYAYVASQNAFIDVEVDIVETANPSTSLAKMTIKKIPGRTAMGEDWDTGTRIEEAYAKCGKQLGAYLVKKAFK